MVRKKVPKKAIEVTKKYVERLKREEKLPVEQVILFGSQVKGKTHKWSDIDVCIISPKFRNPIRAIEFLLIKRGKEEVMAGLEPVGFTKKDFEEGGSLIQEIKKTGVVIT